jgi:hypothetical protein
MSREVETQPFRDSGFLVKKIVPFQTALLLLFEMEFKYQTVRSKKNKKNAHRKKNLVKDISEWTVQDVVNVLDRRR